MAVIEIAKIQVRRGVEGTEGVPQLAPGEFGWAQDTENLYIGKRIAEGANTDENSRILSQKDYDNLFALVMGAGRSAVASTSTYRYRDNLDYLSFQSTTTFIGTKLDAFVSLTDFGVKASSTATDIYTNLNLAIQNLFDNIYLGSDTRRNLIIPAGIYYVSNTVDLPPYTSLVGEGAGLTTLLSLTNDRPMFRTVDANGTPFESSMAEQQSQASSKFVSLKGMTIAYTTGTSVLKPLIYLDNTENSTVDDVEFTVYNVSSSITGTVLTSTSTIYGTALSLRGERRSGVEQNKNVQIVNSAFKNIGLAVLGTGSVTTSKIENNVFSELVQGINFSPFSGDVNRLAPTQSLVSRNNFRNISRQAIFIGTSTDQITSIPNVLNHKSTFNNFYRVGNGSNVADNISAYTGTTAVITNFGEGFNSSGDIFSRKTALNPNLSNTTGVIYKPLVEGNAVAELGNPVQLTGVTTGTQVIDKLFVTDKLVSYKISYTLSDANNQYYSRSGVLTVTANPNPNYSSAASGSASDYFDYTYESTWPVAIPVNNFDLSGELLQPILTVEAGSNNTHLNLVNRWILGTVTTATQLVIKYQINIVS